MLLGIDTCGPVGTLALAELHGEDIRLSGEAEIAGKTYAAMLMPRIRELLQANHASFQQIEAIVVVSGPGSFTGIRVGLSTVKGLIEALNIPVIAVSRLAVLAKKAGRKCAALDAGRGEFYFGNYSEEAHEVVLSLDELRAACPESGLAVCEEKVAQMFPRAHVVAPPRAFDARRDYDDPVLLDGHYLRRADAEVKLATLKA
jgi:tRNA threonylcarbamoyladenosine biosynthesis protein TsaB